MNKSHQRSLASLTAEEKQQLAIWVREEPYEVVRARVNKPRSEGGFGLNISVKPLQTFRDKVDRLSIANQILKNRTNPELTVAEFEGIIAGDENNVSEEVHDSILEATRHMVLSGDNKPTDLLALQRLADFPVRAQIRQEKHELQLAMTAHRKEMDAHRKQMSEKHFDLALRKFAFTEEQAKLRATERAEDKAAKSQDSASSNSKSFKLWTADEVVNNQAKIEAVMRADPILRHIGLPPDTEVDPVTGAPILVAAENDSSASSTPPESGEASGSSFGSQLATTGSIQLDRWAGGGSGCGHAAGSALPASLTLEQRVDEYTLARHFEAATGKDRHAVGLYPAWNFKTKMLWCPCGNKTLPCPQHGHFPEVFWKSSPSSGDYLEALQIKGLPFTAPNILIERQKTREKLEAAVKAGVHVDPVAVKAHAVARWRSHTPRPRDVPPPDELWTEQCPCGNPHPCALHPGLYNEVRYLKPWHADYIAALGRHGISIYTPTPGEITPDAAPPAPQRETVSSGSGSPAPSRFTPLEQRITNNQQ